MTAVTHFPCGTGNDFITMFGNDKARFYDLTELMTGEVRPHRRHKVQRPLQPSTSAPSASTREIGTDVHKYSGLPVVGGAAGYVVSARRQLCEGRQAPP